MKRNYPIFSVVAFLLFICQSLSLMANNDKYRLCLRDNPATSVVVGWNQISGSNPTVYYGTTDFGTNWSSYPNSKTVSKSVDYRGMNNQFARLTGLTQDTAYYFVIRDSEGTSRRFWFKTSPSSADSRFSFIAGGDSRNSISARINANKLVAKLRPHAVFFGGDMTNNDTDSEWTTWFDHWQNTIGSDGRMIPIVATRGNHESSNNVIYNLFDVPSSEAYYALTFGSTLVRSYTLNSEISISGSQTSWLQGDLAANRGVTWKMAQYHKPMRPHVASKSEGNKQYSNWASLFYNNNVRLVVECDAHTVKTTWPLKPSTASGSDEGFIRDDTNGTVYAGEGCWGAPTRTNDDDKEWTRSSGSFNQFKWIFVDKSKIELRTIIIDNANEVDQVNDNNIFAIPNNLDIWSPSNGPVVTILPADTGGDITASARISNGNDDVEQNQDGSISVTSTDLELVADGSAGNQTIGLRFKDLFIPQGAEITSAYVQFTTDETSTGTTDVTIKGHDTDNSSVFTTADNNVSSRTKTSASVSWSIPAWNSEGEAESSQRTPSIKNIVQELVSRPGWSENSRLSLILTGTGKRTAESYEGSSNNAPLIVITYSTGGGGSDSGSGQSAYKGPHNIPGLIQAENFDNGGNNTGYFDTSPGNNGKTGRTDQDVDIQNTSDVGGGQNVGWTSNQEYLQYTLANISAGTYDIKVRVASNNSAAKSININLAGQDLGTASVPNTGGWQNWQDVIISNVTIAERTNQIMQVTFNTGGINLNHITFEKQNTNETTYKIRARGVGGNAQITFKIDNADVESWSFGTEYETKTFTSSATGDIQIYFQDVSGVDAQIDWIEVDGSRKQAEDQTYNTAAWSGTCGGGTKTEMMHCTGVIGFGSSTARLLASINIVDDNAINLYPNPINEGYFNLDLSGLEKNEQLSLTLIDMSGKNVFETSLKGGQTERIDISNLSNGYYGLILYGKNTILKQATIHKK